MSGQDLLTLINEILDYSKLDEKKVELNYDNFNLYDGLTDLIEIFKITALKKQIILSLIFHLDHAKYLYGDWFRIKQILTNLLGNAIKFTPVNGKINLVVKLKGSKISVASNPLNSEKYILQLEVIDTGIGISERHQHRIFEAFSQADNSTTKQFGGTGLGLSICSKLVDLMCGKITVASSRSQGSTFTVCLPVQASKELLHQKEHLAQQSCETMPTCFEETILLVEDNLTNQLISKEMLESLGCDVDIVNNGQEAIEALKEKSYNIIFMDCLMPVMDGYEATRLIRKSENRDVPILQNGKKVFVIIISNPILANN